MRNRLDNITDGHGDGHDKALFYGHGESKLVTVEPFFTTQTDPVALMQAFWGPEVYIYHNFWTS